MKNKSFSSKFEELKPPIHLEVERKLLPRLKFMGYVMCTLCLASLAFAMLVEVETEAIEPPMKERIAEPDQIEAILKFELLTQNDEIELHPKEVLNFYLVALIFASIGASCFLIAWKKKKTLFQENKL